MATIIQDAIWPFRAGRPMTRDNGLIQMGIMGRKFRLNRQIASVIANSELVILPDLKHSILLEAGEKVAQEIIRFCNRVS